MADTHTYVDAASFSKALMASLDGLEDAIANKAIRKTCIDLYTRIVKGTPRDTGFAAASWGISTGGASPPEPPEGGWSKDVRDAKIKEYADQEIDGFTFTLSDDRVVIVNNTEYIEELESGTGSPQQAPNGMVAVSIAEFDGMFRQNLQGIEGVEPT